MIKIGLRITNPMNEKKIIGCFGKNKEYFPLKTVSYKHY
jgi:hypothetical protein